MEHPAEEILLRFARGTASRLENRQVVRHLLTLYPACAAKLNRAMQGESPPDPSVYDQPLARLTHQLANENEEPGEEGLLQSTATSGSTAPRRWLFG